MTPVNQSINQSIESHCAVEVATILCVLCWSELGPDFNQGQLFDASQSQTSHRRSDDFFIRFSRVQILSLSENC